MASMFPPNLASPIQLFGSMGGGGAGGTWCQEQIASRLASHLLKSFGFERDRVHQEKLGSWGQLPFLQEERLVYGSGEEGCSWVLGLVQEIEVGLV
jgi:hypothetical protein